MRRALPTEIILKILRDFSIFLEKFFQKFLQCSQKIN